MINSRHPRAARWGAALLLSLALLTLGACGKKSPAEKLQKARDLNQQQKPFDALIELRRIQQDNPGDPIIPDVMFELARTHAALGQLEQAEEQFKKVIENVGFRDARGQASYQSLITLYQRGERLDDAIAITQQFLEALPSDDPTTPALRLSIAQLHLFKGENNTAIAILESVSRATQGAGDKLFVGELLAAAYAREKRFDDSLREYDAMLALTQDPAYRARVEIGKAYYLGEAGRTDERDALTSQAAGVLRREIEAALDPTVKIRTLTELARAYELLKQDGQAEAVYREIIAGFGNQPNAHETYEALAVFHAGRKQWDKARAVLEEEKAKFPSPLIGERITTMLDRLEALRLQDQATTPTQSQPAPPPANATP